MKLSISRRVNKLLSDKYVFDNSKDVSNNAISSSGFKDKIKFNPDFNKNTSGNKDRKRKIIWFNPSYSSNVSTNIGKSFLTILDRHFPKSHKLYKIFNQNNVKISYSSLPNFASIINSHNKKIINNNIPKPSASLGNCPSKISCPLNGDCLQSSLVYICKADTSIITENHPLYIGLTENTFKDQFYKHKNSFKYESKRNTKEVSNFVWGNKHANTETNLVWSILDKTRAYKPKAKSCFLCLAEKYHIIFYTLNLLNLRMELVTNGFMKISFTLLTLKIVSCSIPNIIDDHLNLVDFNSLNNSLN